MRNKVLLLFFSGVLVLMPFLPATNVFAYSGGYFNNTTLNTLTGVPTTKGTDGDIATSFDIRYSAQIPDYVFSSPQKITEVYVDLPNVSTGVSLTNSQYVYFKFYNGANHSGTSYIKSAYELGIKDATWSVIPVQSNIMSVNASTNGNSVDVSISELDFKVDSPIIHDSVSGLIESHKYNEATLSWTNPTNSHFTGTEIYKDGTLLATNSSTDNIYTATGLDPSTSYVFDVYALYDDSLKSTKVTQSVVTDSMPTDPTKIPPSNVTGLIVSDITGTSASLNWSLPTDLDLDKVNIYLNNVLYESLPVSSISVLSNLNPDSNYSVSVSVTDVDGNESPKTNGTFTTAKVVDNTAPDSPQGLKVDQGSNALYVSWAQNNEPDINGYNVYVDGLKVNGALIKNLFYAIADLTNDTSYSVTVSAVDNSGNESVQSSLIAETPKGSKMPLLSIGYTLIDVVTGVNGWFSSLWLVIAFAVAIPLSFYVASRLKLMFLE
jgi:hypothetical protein